MTQPAAQAPAWVAPLTAALLTVGTVWTTIRTEVPNLVREQMAPELAALNMAMEHHADSLWSSMADTLIARSEQQAKATVDSLVLAVGIIADKSGPVQYRPRITVTADTAGTSRLSAQVDTLLQANRDLLRQVARLTTAVGTNKRRTSQNGYP